jgi:DNA-binding NarL/FixJ family response regulator
MLIADDHELVRHGLKLILLEEFSDAQVGESGNARETLEQLSAREWDLVLLDLNMPVMSGWELHAALQQRQITIPVIYMTAGKHACAEAERYGADGCLPKPFDLDEVVRVVARFTHPAA